MINYINTKLQLKFDWSCLKQDKVTFTPKAVLNFYIIYTIDLRAQFVGANFALENSLFGAVKLTENDDPYKYFYYGYGNGLDVLRFFQRRMVVGLVGT